MTNKERKKFAEDFKKELESNQKTIIIPKSVKRDFEYTCVKEVNSYANKLHDWRDRSLRSASLLG